MAYYTQYWRAGLKERKKGRGRKRQQIIDFIMAKENDVIMKRTAEDRIRWMAKRQQQKDDACQKPANK